MILDVYIMWTCFLDVNIMFLNMNFSNIVKMSSVSCWFLEFSILSRKFFSLKASRPLRIFSFLFIFSASHLR
jgi:hypothetical protein